MLKTVRFPLIIAVILVAIASLAGCSDTKTVQLSRDSVILAFGDSLTQGVGAPAEQSYPAHLARALGVNVINAGNSGETSAQGLTRIKALLEQYSPDLVIICYGGNDLLRRLPVNQLANNLEQMIQLSQAHGAQVLLVGVPKPAIFLDPVPVYSDLAKRYQLAAELDILSDLLDDKGMKSDTIHLNSKGYQAFAKALAAHIDITPN
ncbi:arylesterase [Motilimonas eburnea]|uniref:arylesterase n=1 Tax=Motilimonas eburnea TaxID=1737488 RepID=UPI001E4E6A71|nr:arylesterase [Motilimonas eburnea]MCE2570247.1 arylesterase [Motilimonas eburnea]